MIIEATLYSLELYSKSHVCIMTFGALIVDLCALVKAMFVGCPGWHEHQNGLLL